MEDIKDPAPKIKKIIKLKKSKEIVKRRKKVLKNLVIISVFILFSSFVWVILEGYHLLLSKEMVEESTYLAKPLNPEIDGGLILESKRKKFFSLEEIDNHYKSSQLPVTLDQEGTGSGQLESESSLVNAQE